MTSGFGVCRVTQQQDAQTSLARGTVLPLVSPPLSFDSVCDWVGGWVGVRMKTAAAGSHRYDRRLNRVGGLPRIASML